MMRTLVFLAVLLPGCAAVQPPAACYAPEWEWETHVRNTLQAVGGASFVELAPEQRAAFLREYNGSGEPSGYQWERVGWFFHPDSLIGRLIFGVCDCAWFWTMVPTAAMQGFVGNGV